MLQSTLLAFATLVVVIFGLGVVAITMVWPSLLLLAMIYGFAVPMVIDFVPGFALTFGLVNVVHLYMLYTDAHHVAVYQCLWLSVRRLLVPVVMWVARIESIREETPTLYQKIPSNDDETFEMSRSVRRRYRKMEEIFRQSAIRHEAVYCDGSGVPMCQLLPILWEHQCRICPKNASAEFIKRFLVVTLMPDGLLDLYYDKNRLVAFQFSMRQGPSLLHWFMYFCRDDYTQCGIWFHGIRLALRRGQALVAETGKAVWVNGQVHQDASKLNAGLEPGDHTNTDLMSQLYPFTSSTAIDKAVVELKLWSTD